MTNIKSILSKLNEPLSVISECSTLNPEVLAQSIQEKFNAIFGPFGWDHQFIEIFNETKLFALKCTISVTSVEDGNITTQYKKQNAVSVGADTQYIYEKLFISTAKMLGVNTQPTATGVPDVVVPVSKPSTEEPSVIDVPSEPTINPSPEALSDNISKSEAPEMPEPVAIPGLSETLQPIQTGLTAKEILSARAGANEPIKPRVHVKEDLDTGNASTSAETASQDTSVSPLPEETHIPLTAETLSTLPVAEKNLVNELIQKLETVSPAIVKTYITGPKGKERLSERSRAYLMDKIDEKSKKSE